MSRNISFFLPNNREMTFVEHLTEFRYRLIFVLAAIGVSMVGVYILRYDFLAFLEKPVGRLYYYSPGEAFITELELSFCGGVFFALPVILNQLWLFFTPALYDHEKRYLFSGLLFSYFFLILALLFLYSYLPLIIQFCFHFAQNLARPAISYEVYLLFVGKIILFVGLAFEMPLIFFLLTKTGVLTPVFLWRKHPYALLIIFSIAALLTPPDIISLLLLSVPLIILYEVGILFSYLAYRGKTQYAG